MRRLLLPAFASLAFWCLVALPAKGQNLQGEISPTAYNWKSPEDATNFLLAQIGVLNQQFPGLTPGTPLYDNTLRRIAYFKAIVVEIGRGAAVPDAMELSLPAAATLGFEKEASYTPKIVLKALYSETRVLLTD